MDQSISVQTPHVAVLPTPGMGHLIPLAELAKRLAHHHDFSITFITFAESNSKAQQSFLRSLPKSITSVSLPPVKLDHLPPDASIETRMSVASALSVPAVADVLRGLKKARRLVAFVSDLFGADTFDAAKELGIPAYLFFPTNFLALSMMLHLPSLDKEIGCELRDLPTPVKLPGCVPIPGKDVMSPLQDRNDESYSWMLHHGGKYREAEGILVNTFEEMEPEAAEAFRAWSEPPVWAVGPLIRTGSGEGLRDGGSGCLAWLDGQPRGSVLFVSFGSGGTLSTEQTHELALGLEMSGQRFLWVVRDPSDREPNASYFKAAEEPSEGDRLGFLPEGFVGRSRGVGLAVASWAPQTEVLGHGATGGFLTHCGWNSTLESVARGVPMIAWPLFAEQRQNAVMLTEGVGAALRIRFGDDGVARRGEISEAVKELMEGEQGKGARSRVRELQEAAARALEEEGGKSYKAIAAVASKWKAGLPVPSEFVVVSSSDSSGDLRE